MTTIHGTSAVPVYVGGDGHENGAVSEVPASARSPSVWEVVPHPAADVGGLENLPGELFSPDEQLADELDHAGLDFVLPDEDHVRGMTV